MVFKIPLVSWPPFPECMFSCRWHRSSPSCALELITSASLWLSGSLKNFLLIIGSDHFIKVIQEDRNRESRVEGLLDRFNLFFFFFFCLTELNKWFCASFKSVCFWEVLSFRCTYTSFHTSEFWESGSTQGMKKGASLGWVLKLQVT